MGLDSNRLMGSLPSSIGQLSKLTAVSLSRNSLAASIPSSIGQLSNLTALSLSDNSLTGSLPSSIGQLSKLSLLILSRNSLTGSLPSSIGQLSKLSLLSLSGNSLTGSILSSIGQLSKLTLLSFSSNSLTGSIPPSIGQLSKLTGLYLSGNSLTGSIPSSIGQLSKLSLLYLSRNSLTGSIPLSIGQLSKLTLLSLSGNSLTGSIPSSIGQLSKLTSLSLSFNSLTGSIPSSIGQLSNLTSLSLSFNSLTGSLPSSIGQLSKLTALSLSFNSLTGSLPSSIGQLSKLTSLSLSGNSLTGSLPSSIGQLSKLSLLILSGNSLTGSLPSSIQKLKKLAVLSLSSNWLAGTIASEISLLTALNQLFLNNNMFTSTIPSWLGELSKLLDLSLNSNSLTGTIPSELFSKDIKLVNISLDDNKLSGVFPSAVFNSGGSVQRFRASSNCFSGEFPSTNCSQLTDMVELYLNGLGSSGRCSMGTKRFDFFPPITGNVPSCLWSLANLETLHIAGNGLSGYLPDSSIVISKKLIRVNIAANNMKGYLRPDLMSSAAVELDISSNKIHGSVTSFQNLSSAALSNFTFSAYVNRLSGGLPVSQLKSMQKVNILIGNMYRCEDSRGLTNDEKYGEYSCGSETLDVSMIVWFLVFFFIGIFFLVLLYLSNYFENIKYYFKLLFNLHYYFSMQKLFSAENTRREFVDIVEYVELLWRLLVLSSFTTSVVIIWTVILYSSMKIGDGESYKYVTHSAQFSWNVSAAYVSGSTPVICLFLLFLLIVLVLGFSANRLVIASTNPSSVRGNDTVVSTSRLVSYLAFLTVLSFHVIVFGIVHAVYVLYREELGDSLVFIQLLIAIFDMMYETGVVYASLCYLVVFFPASKAQVAMFYVWLRLALHVGIPTIATVFLDQLCFANVVLPQRVIDTSYDVALCVDYDSSGESTTCVDYGTKTTFSSDVVEPFVYSVNIISNERIINVLNMCFNVLLNMKILESVQECCYHVSSTHNHIWRSLHFFCHSCVEHDTDESALQGFMYFEVCGSLALALSSSFAVICSKICRRHGCPVHMSNSIWDAAAICCISNLH